jgi:hypothetical protein
MKFDLGILKFELGGAEPTVPVLLSTLSVADTQEAIAAGPTLAKNKPITHRRSFSVGVSLPKEGEAKEKAVERTLAEVVKRSQAKVRKEENRTSAGGPAKVAEIAHKQGQTSLRSFVYITFAGQWIVTGMHTGLDLKTNEQAMRDRLESFAKSLAAG